MAAEDRCLRNLVLVGLLDELGWSISRFVEEINRELERGYVSYPMVWGWVNLSQVPPWPLPPVVAQVLSRALGRPLFVHNLWSEGPAIPQSIFQSLHTSRRTATGDDVPWNILTVFSDPRGPIPQLARAELPFATRLSERCADRMREADFHRAWLARTQSKRSAGGPSVSDLAVPGMATSLMKTATSARAFKSPRDLDPDRAISRHGRESVDARGVHNRAQTGAGGVGG